MIKCTYPYQTDAGDPTTLGEFLEIMLRKVKFKDLEREGANMFVHAMRYGKAVLVMDSHSTIETKTECDLGDMLLAKMHGDEIRVLASLPFDIRQSIARGFFYCEKPVPETKSR